MEGFGCAPAGTDLIRFVGLEAVQGQATLLRIDSDCPQAQLPGGAENPNGNFTAIGREQRDRALRVVEHAQPRRILRISGTSPRRLLVSSVASPCRLNHTVERGTKLLTVEVMKMQSNIYAPLSGHVANIRVAPSQHLEAKDLLVAIAP